MMKAEELVQALRELEGRGWPVSIGAFMVNVKTGQVGGWDVWLKGYRQSVTLEPDKSVEALHWVHASLLTGFLVSQLEARGLRREVRQYLRDKPYVSVLLLDPTKKEPEVAERGDTDEFSALLKACLALPAEAAP
jgi:hypothetical protein